MKALSTALFATILVFSTSAAIAGKPPSGPTVWYVSATAGADNNVGNKPAKPFHTIVKALSMAQDGDSIKIAEGIYSEMLTINATDSLALQGGWNEGFSSWDPRTYIATLLGNGKDTTTAFVGIDCQENTNLTIEGLKITNFYQGVYVYTTDHSAPPTTISNCIIEDNTDGVVIKRGNVVVDSCDVSLCSHGIYGMAYDAKRLRLTNNIIHDNSYAGIYAYGVPPGPWTIANNVAYNNTWQNIFVSYYVFGDIINNTVSSSNSGIAVYGWSNPNISNNIIVDSEIGVNVNSNSTASLQTNLLFNNITDYTNTIPVSDIYDDPQFDGTFHISDSSTARDAGTDFSLIIQDDIDGDPRTVDLGGDGWFDIGADEYFVSQLGCSDHTDQVACDADATCEWNRKQGICVEIGQDCSVYSDEPSCTAAGCNWNSKKSQCR